MTATGVPAPPGAGEGVGEDAAGRAPRPVLVVCADLLSGGPLVRAVRAAGRDPVRVLSVAKVPADPAGFAGVLLDLTLPGAAGWLAERSGRAPPVLSFCPHVRTDLLAAARAASAGPVLTRSRLATGVPRWLVGLAG